MFSYRNGSPLYATLQMFLTLYYRGYMKNSESFLQIYLLFSLCRFAFVNHLNPFHIYSLRTLKNSQNIKECHSWFFFKKLFSPYTCICLLYFVKDYYRTLNINNLETISMFNLINTHYVVL